MNTTKPSFIVDWSGLPALYPTNAHSGPFWEQLGRTIGSFGFLEQVLGRAIFAFTGTRNYSEGEIEAAYKAWLPKLEGALNHSLSKLAEEYGTAVKGSKDSTDENVDELVQAIQEAAKVRNILCHASWGAPDDQGKSLPSFVTKKMQVCETKFDIASLRQIHNHIAHLACDVVDSVTRMGFTFPGSDGPGVRIWRASCPTS